MRKTLIATGALGLLALSVSAADSKKGFSFMSVEQAATLESGRAIESAGQATSAAMWIWADKHVYTAGEQLTLRWTVNANNDLYPYTIFAFRQNNQTGVRSYFPGGGSTPTDIFGNTAQQGYRITSLPTQTRQVLVGAGGAVSPSPAGIPNEPGMHTLVVQIRDYTGGQVIKAAYWKIGIVTATEALPNSITTNTTLTNDKAYRISGIVAVTNNATLTINPGTFLIGQPGSIPPSVLLITTAGRIDARGTRSRPIIMTSSQPIGSRQRGDWGGLILLGRAPLNTPGSTASIEGLPNLPETVYGGADPAHNCGALRYVRVEFAGALLRANEETNSITWGGCGSQTTGEYLQAHYGLDDAFEWFGGTNDAKYLVGTYPADDFLDFQLGSVMRVQHALMVANDDRSNRGVESDNNENNFGATPRTLPRIWNATFVGGGTDGFDEAGSRCLHPRRGTGLVVANSLCYHWINGTVGGGDFDTLPVGNASEFNMNGIVSWDNGFNANPPAANTVQAQVATALQAFASDPARQFLFANPMLRAPLQRSSPDFRPVLGSPLWGANWIAPPDDGFFDQSANYAGAFGNEDWTEEWATFAQEQEITIAP